MNIYKINLKKLLILILCFVIFTPIGTITHELGHIIVAKYLGYDTQLKYSSTEWNNDFKKEVIKLYNNNQFEIEKKVFFKDKKTYDVKIKKYNQDELIISIGGVLMTIIIGSIGFVLLFNSQKRKNNLSCRDWLLVFFTLFWSREVLNLIKGIINGFIFNKGVFFSGDELKISEQLNIYQGMSSIILGIIGLVLITILILKIIPIKLRLTFIISGLLGGILGFIIWMKYLGPFILP